MKIGIYIIMVVSVLAFQHHTSSQLTVVDLTCLTHTFVLLITHVFLSLMIVASLKEQIGNRQEMKLP